MSNNEGSPDKNNGDFPEGGRYEDYLAMLEDHRKNCERDGNFVEANIAKQRIEDLKIQEGQRQLENLMLKQQQDRLQMEEEHAKEYENFQSEWDQRMQQKEQEHNIALQQLEENQQKELEMNRANLEQKISQVFKASSELLNLRKIQDQLARQKEYAEAHKVQAKILELERIEQDKYNGARNKKIVAAETTLIQKQQIQMNALRKKCEGQMAEDRKLREQQQEKMLQRYMNIKKELENAQNLERIKLEKLFGKQILASQTSLSYGQNKDNLQYSARLGSPGRKNWASASANLNNPASKPSNQ
ncbi:UNKNOWN [Stylonychia lemnae]|uniref:Uncharacterized protein n=1 Tax=Stylonychia lemnae TaxID=5949 RepID=A0A078ATR7_STYLE|nr:UNKNOWN [Stylonychia lemnae]|eukprot:CDW84238.1 UNKNOWN [Stylonychia lemnae]